MGSLKFEQRQKVKSDQERGQEVIEMGEQRIRELEEYLAFDQIEAIDDDDKAAVDAVRGKVSVETDIIPDEAPIYVTGPGFDDFSTPEEIERFPKKYSNIILADDTPFVDDSPIGESDNQQIDSAKTEVSLTSSLEQSEDKFRKQENLYETELTEKEKFEQMVEELQKLF